jgi:hypothetical protein
LPCRQTSNFGLDLGGTDELSAHELFVWHGFQLHGLLEKTVKQEAASLGSAAVETEREFVEVVVELGGMDSPMVNSQPPPIEETGNAVNTRHNDMGWVAAGGNALRQMFEADFRETIVGSPAVGSNRRTWAYGRLDERNEALGRYVSDTRHADTTGAPPPDFSSHRDNRFLLCFPTDNASLTAANEGFVNLDIAL